MRYARPWSRYSILQRRRTPCRRSPFEWFLVGGFFLITHETTVEDLGAKAPRAIKRDVQTSLTGANAAIAQNDAALANTPAMENASGRIKAYCGITG